MDRASERAKLLELLGDLPAGGKSVPAHCLSCEPYGSYVLEKLVLDLNGQEPVPAYFARPASGQGPFPTVLYNHAHGGDYALGKNELIDGRIQLQRPPYADALTRRGYAVLCFDTWAFGERAWRTESAVFKDMLWHGQVMWGMMVWDSIRALDYLGARPDVQPDRIATLGLSMGSTMAWWLAALDERVAVCVDLCCLTDFQALLDSGGLDGHGIYYYVPRLLRHFSTAGINALIAPRPHLAIAGNRDSLTPPDGLDRIDAALRRVYAEAGAADAWSMLRYDVGHVETAAMRGAVLDFLDTWL